MRTVECGDGGSRLGVGEEVWHDLHLVRKAELAMLRTAELAHRDESIEMLQLSAHESGPPPPLRRPAINELTPKALTLITQLAVVAPQHVRWTDEPVLVRHVQLRGVPAVRKDSGSADQRCVVKVDDVEAAVIQY